MIHARKDYDRIQDPEGKIPEDEPVFLLRGQDIVAPQIVEMWALAAKKVGANDIIYSHAMEHAQLMRYWQSQHGSKVPDMPKEE